MNKTGIMTVGGRLASLYDDCIKMRVYSNKTTFKETYLSINNFNDMLHLCPKMGINRIYVSVASGKDIASFAQNGIALIEEEELLDDELYQKFIFDIYHTIL